MTCWRCDEPVDEPTCPHWPLCADCDDRGWCGDCETEKADAKWQHDRDETLEKEALA